MLNRPEIRKILLAVFVLPAMFSQFYTVNAQTVEKQNKRGVEIIKNEAEKRVDILIGGEPFTSYLWADDLKKPVLFPVRTARGTTVTRGFPLEPREGESVDHPHQIGLWLNYGDLNGVDFWNNSVYRTAEESAKMGTIVQRKIAETKNGRTSGTLIIEADWIMPDGKTILHEKTEFIFQGEKDWRSINRRTTLTALDERAVFNDSKEGFFGLRVRRELEQPAEKPILLTDASGKPSPKPVLDNRNVTGEFRSGEGKTGDEVWGTRAKWAMLAGRVKDEFVTIAILDNPANIGFPTYWMARGYGLFAANPLGQKAFSTEKKEAEIKELKFTLEPKQSVTFRYRVLIFSDKKTPEQIESEYRKFLKIKS